MKMTNPGLYFLNLRCLRNIYIDLSWCFSINYHKLRIYLLTGNIKIRFPGIIGRITAPPRCPHLNPQNLQIHNLPWQRDFADVIEVRVMEWGDFLYYPTGPNTITRILIREMWKGPTEKMAMWQQKQQVAICEEEATGRGIQVTSGRWEKQRNRFSPRASRNQPCQHAISWVKLILDFWFPEL